MPDFPTFNGSLLLQTDPTDLTLPLGISRTDVGLGAALAQIIFQGSGAGNLQGLMSFQTNLGVAAGPLVEHMRIHTNGNVGIGVAAPTEKLEVAGRVKAAGFLGDGSALTGLSDASKVSKAGDSMTGPLSLPANGLSVGSTQLVVSGGSVGIGTTTPRSKLDVEGGAVIGTTYSGTSAAPVNGLLVEGNLGIGTVSPTQKLDVVGNIAVSGTVDGVNISNFKADVDGRSSRYFAFGNLNASSVNVGTTWTKLGTVSGSHAFTKARADTKIEVHVGSRFSSGVFSGTSGIHFQARVDDQPSVIGNDGAITASNAIQFLSLFGVFQGLASGSHTVSIWAQVGGSGSSASVVVDPGGWGGKIIVKETW